MRVESPVKVYTFTDRPETVDPLGHLTVIQKPSSWNAASYLVAPETFPRAFLDNPQLTMLHNFVATLDERGLYARHYLSASIPLESLIKEASKKSFDFKVLLKRQRKMHYHDRDVYVARSRQETPKFCWDHLPESSPVTYTGEYFASEDSGVNTFIAHLLANREAVGENGVPIESLDDLSEFALSQGITLNADYLRKGFINLVKPANLRLLQETGVMPVNRGNYFTRTADYLTAIAIHNQVQRRQDPDVSNPYPLYMEKDDYAAVEFLPFMAYSFYDYLTRLPGSVRADKTFEHGVVGTNLQKLYALVGEVLQESVRQSVSQESIAKAQRAVNAMVPEFYSLLKVLQQNPSLLNRAGMNQTVARAALIADFNKNMTPHVNKVRELARATQV